MGKFKKFVIKYKGLILAFTGGVLSYHGLQEYTPVLESVLNSVGG